MEPPPPKPPRPQITSSNSPEYRRRLADISSRACLDDPLILLFQRDRLGPTAQITLQDIYTTTLARIETKTALGSLVVEADGFAAVACWEPPGTAHRNHDAAELAILARSRPLYAAFITDIEAARAECLGPKAAANCWQLSLMARDPRRASAGAVTALIEPLVRRARRERVPVWCVAGTERARDVYAFFGFEVVKVVCSGETETETVRTWCMVCNWPPVESEIDE